MFTKASITQLAHFSFPTMKKHLDVSPRLQLAATLFMICSPVPLVSSVEGAPVDKKRSPEVALTEPLNAGVVEERQEISLLAPPQAESVSVGDLPTENEASPSDSLRFETAPQGELLQTRFADGKVHIERHVTEDNAGNLVNHGDYKEYDNSGKLIRSGRYEMGQMDGTWSQVISAEALQSLSSKLDPGFRPPFKSEAGFVLGQLHGDWTVVDSKGSPVFVWQFEFNKRENVSTWFDSRQNAITEILYRGGLPHGPATQLVAGQKEPKKFVYDQGRVVQTKTHWYEQNKRKKAEESYLYPASNLLVDHDWWTSKVRSEAQSPGNAVRHGALVTWHPNGQKSFEGQFVNGEPSGEFKWWYANGQPQIRGMYDNGASVGEWVWWHPNGMKMIQGSYESGKQVGQWSKWETDGSLVLRADADSFPAIKPDLEMEPVQVAESRSQAPERTISSQPAQQKRMIEARAASKRLR